MQELRRSDPPDPLQVREVLHERVPRGVQQREATRHQARGEEESRAVTLAVGFLVIASAGLVLVAVVLAGRAVCR